ncbi:4Fe-4S binding protein [Candidatus Sulfurimonas marisnigri]|uniref:4Fe-4S binding protein n=1 Tax=Candidatus Sulfurimonas marisnigri TaxID=2740405 RepID=A0A7S7LZG2_9BACT|nr:4Fe-4S binding protein [Candidatus Sulfurimonas marisnigri]QOY54110.1 4Fe-4S binding protein [Candidatus Sulfurimonas marisnigri]
MIQLSAGLCVRSLSKDSECNRCETICPTGAIVVADNPLPSINFSACVACGACGAVCPNEALSLDDFSSTDFFFKFIEDDDNLISCKKNVPCIAALNIENIISMAVLKKEIVFDMGHCDGCDIAHKCKPQIEKNYEEASYILEAMENPALIKVEDVRYEKSDSIQDVTSNRREFLSSVNLKAVAKTKHAFEKEIQKATDELIEHTLQKSDIALLKQKRIPDRRKLFFTAIKRVKKPSQYHVIEADEITFTSMKLLDSEKCTACQMCYRVCPSGALTSDIKNSKIDFDPFLCIKCHICHDVCEPDAITLSPSYNVKEFFEPAVQSLIKFNVRRCNECNVIFSTNTADKLCYRCKAEDEEARELWGITDDM